MSIKALPEYALLEKYEFDNKTASGLEVPSSGKERPMLGRVLDIDHKKIKKGDVVAYKKYSNQDLKVKGKEYQIVEIKDIMAIVEE